MFCPSLLIYGTPFAENKLGFSAHSKNNGVSWGVHIWSECSWGHRITLSQFCYRNYHYPISSSSLWGNGSYSPSMSSGAFNWLQIKDLFMFPDFMTTLHILNSPKCKLSSIFSTLCNSLFNYKHVLHASCLTLLKPPPNSYQAILNYKSDYSPEIPLSQECFLTWRLPRGWSGNPVFG